MLTLILAMGCGVVSAQELHDSIPEIVVTGTGTEHLLKNAPVQTEVISRRMLDNYAGKSVEEILGGLTASFAFNEGDMGSQMQLNGLGNSYILILINGKRLHGDNGGENDLGLIDPHNIERIEIVKGAQSALYGSDAIAGVVNIITKKHDKDGLMVENSTRVGSYSDVRQHNGLALSWGKWESYTNFQLQHTDGWQNTAEEYTEAKVVTDSRNKTVNRYTNWQISERLTFTPTKDLTLYAEGWYYNKIINRPQNGNHPSCDVYTYDLMYNNASAATGGKWMMKNKDFLSLDIDWNKHAYFYKYTARTYEDAYIDGVLEHGVPMYKGQKRLQADQHRTMAQLKGVFHLPCSNVLNVGTEFRYDYLEAPMRTKGGEASDWTAALYAQDEFNMLEWFNITAGVRLIENEAFGFHLTPKVSTMFSAGDFRLRLGWSEGFKTPTPKELNYQYLRHMGSSTFFYMGNPDLKPQTSSYWSAGLEYRNSRLSVSVTGYLNELDNMIALVNIPVSEIPVGSSEFMGDGSMGVVPRMYKNTENAKTSGIDVNVNFNITKDLACGGNYSYLDTDANVYNDSRNKHEKVTIDGMAHNKWNAYVTWNHRFAPSYRLGAGVYARGSSKRYYQNDGDGKKFQIWRLSTTHDLGPQNKKATYKVELGVDNIFNYVDKTMHPYHLGTTTAGTTVYGTFTVRFNQGKKIKNYTNNKKTTNYEED
ncbi:MAG: TonB-dependent receptor [Bacteroidaceae bacterium]|nr:TonB-dependent receptor [Bacteroidaceae bacterium]